MVAQLVSHMALISTERIHTGRIINLDVDTVRFPDGSALTNPSLVQVKQQLATFG